MTVETYGYLTADATTGRIMSIRFPTGPLPTVGVSEDGLFREVILTSANLPNEQCRDWNHFVMNYYYNEANGGFFYTGLPPNDYASWDFTTNAWEWPAEKVLDDIRLKRNAMIASTDWMLLPDSTLTEEQKAQVTTYRQQLRDLPSTVTGNPATREDIDYPVFPF